MAMDSISGTRTSGVTVSRTGDGARRASAAAGDASTSSGASAKSSSLNQHVIDIEGRSFNRYAPRGTYLNIVV